VEKEFYYLRLDARHFYSKEEWAKMPEKDKKKATERIREINNGFEKKIKA